MTEVTIPTGQGRDGWIVISVNGDIQWIKAGEPTNLSDAEIEVLNHAGINYNYNLPNGTEPYVVIDFENGVYQVGGVAKALSDVCGQDAVNWNTFDPAEVIAGVGYKGTGKGPIIIGDALTYMLQGKTFLIDFTLGAADTIQLSMFSTDNLTNTTWWLKSTSSVATNTVDQLYLPEGAVAPGGSLLGAHKMAVTHQPNLMAISIDGDTTGSLTSDPWTPTPEIFGLYCDGNSVNTVIRSLSVYPVQPTEDLPTLSALS